MYSVADYGSMIADRERMRAYVGALERVVKPGCVVLDLGAGTGIFSLYACRFGARRVYAIEPNTAVALLPEIARRNGFADRIEVIAKESTDVTLPERVDVIVSDLRGAFPLFGGHLRVVRDARKRLLREGGVLLPHRDELMACLVSAPELYAEIVEPWRTDGFDLSPCAAEALAETYRDHRNPLLADHCVSTRARWAVVDYATKEDDRASGSCALRCERDAVVHGIATWFRATIFDDLGFENAPGSALVYRRTFLPWPEPVAVTAGTEVRVQLDALPAKNDYMFAWSTEILGGPAFKQSTFLNLNAGVWGVRGSLLSRTSDKP